MPSSGVKHDPAEISAQCRGKKRMMEAVYCNRRRDGRNITDITFEVSILPTGYGYFSSQFQNM
jgi:hypothetical protein